MPIFDIVNHKTLEKAQNVLDKRNEHFQNIPDLENHVVFVERNRPRKTDPPFEPITVRKQDQTKIDGKAKKGKITTANISKIKKLRKTSLSQVNPVDDEPHPGPSNQSN